MRPAATTLAVLALCWPASAAAGWLLRVLGLATFDLLGRAGLLILALTLAEALLARLGRHP